jgi:hypothetical protein
MADTLAQPVEEALADLGLRDPEDVEAVWNHPDWVNRRNIYEERRGWYKGTEWTQTLRDVRDPTGEYELQWPLQLNPIAKVCRIHRAVMMGMQREIMGEAPIITLVSRQGLDESQGTQADILQDLISRVWHDSKDHSILFEACLLTQYFGDHVFRIAWEPFNRNPFDFWDLLDCYIGYEIDKELARSQFGITPKNDKLDTVLYMEHWTKTEYQVTVDGQVPQYKLDDGGRTYAYEGLNKWGVVPIVHIPHDLWSTTILLSSVYRRSLTRGWPTKGRAYRTRSHSSGQETHGMLPGL